MIHKGGFMRIRHENKKDAASIQAVNNAAFESAAEAGLVDALREQAHPVISLVADDGGVFQTT
jgi:putative acetyltransferase